MYFIADFDILEFHYYRLREKTYYDLNQISIPSSDIERSINFYQGLGHKLIVKALPHYARFECLQGEATFSLHLTEAIDNKTPIKIYFEDDDLDEVVQNLLSQGYHFQSPPEDKRWLWREASLHDPDGNLIILFKAGKNRKNPPWRI